jgi:hypothetical protein
MMLDRRRLTGLVAALVVLVVVLGIALLRGSLANHGSTPTSVAQATLTATSVAVAGTAPTTTEVPTLPVGETQVTLEPSAATSPLTPATPPVGVGQPLPGGVPAAPVPVVPTPLGVPAAPIPVVPTPLGPSSGVFIPPATSPPPPVIVAPRLLTTPTSPVQAPTSAHPTLSAGATGAAVSELQSRLNGWITAAQPAGIAPLAVDGIFGPRTAAAVRAYQRAHGLVVDGIVGPRTWESLLQ